MQAKTKNILLLFIGAFSGLVNGFFGGGGGMLIVPFLVYIMKEPQKESQATTMSIILPISVVSAITYILTKNFTFDINMFSSLGVILGGVIGALVLKKINSNVLKIIFVFVMLISGIKMLF